MKFKTTINGISKIKDDGGDYIVLADYGYEGLSAVFQCERVWDAIHFMSEGGNGSEPMTLVKLVHVRLEDAEEYE